VTEQRRRWDGDERRTGVRSGHPEVGTIANLTTPMARDGWLTEDPIEHLGPKLQEWLDAHGDGPWRVESLSLDNDWLVVDARWLRHGRRRELRADAYALIGALTESTSFIEQRHEAGVLVYEVATGQPDGEFAAHGHLVRVRIHGGDESRNGRDLP